MKLLSLLSAVLLTGCAHGLWLDGVDIPQRVPAALSDAEAARLTADALALREQARQVRDRLAFEADRRARFTAYRQLRDLHEAQLPIERRLEDAGRALPTTLTRPGA